jgi:ATP-dependent RNA helicase MSS116
VTAQANAREAQAHERHQQALQDPSLLSNQVFAERTDLHPATRRALTETMGLTFMTEIQSKTYAAASSGQSILASAKTGTGKTLAFLIPALERVLQGTDRSLYVPGRNIAILVLAPTRELSIQIANQARLLLTFHSKDLSVMDMYGGTKMARDLALLNKRIPTILVATPGKLLEHITSTRVGGGGRRFSDIISQTRIVVLDETDRLLDSGFQRDVCKILSHLPRREKRQTLLFSATMPTRIKSAMKDVLSLNYTEIHVDNQDNENKTGDNLINTRVKQSYFMLTSMDNYVVTLLNLVMNAIQSTDKFKILVFFPATKLVRFFAQVCNHVGLEVPVRELHSRMSQSARQRASSDFSSSSRAVLFTSDVSARGKALYE